MITFRGRTIESWLWDTQPRNSVTAFLLRLSQYAYTLLRDAFGDEIMMRSMALVYTTILSLVPLIAFALTLLKGFGVHRSYLEPLLFNFLAPLGSQGGELTEQIIGYVDNVNLGTLTLLGLGFLLITVIFLLYQIEDSLNFIWRVKRSSNLIKRLSAFISLVLVGPLVLFVVFAVGSSIHEYALIKELAQYQWFGDTLYWLQRFLPYLLLALIFSFLYVFFPDTRVQGFAALVGGVFAAVLWIWCGLWFTDYAASSAAHYTAIYSSFAIVILTLFWFYLSWVIFHLGAQVSFYYQNPHYMRTGRRVIRVGNRQREHAALSIMLIIARAFRRGELNWNTQKLAVTLSMPVDTLSFIIQRLQTQKLLTLAADGNLLPARALDEISAQMILDAVRTDTGEVPAAEPSASINALLERIEQGMKTAVGDLNLAELTRQNEEDDQQQS